MTIAVDFDGTIVTHKYPEIGEEIPFATETLKTLIREGHKIILWSVREGKMLDEAIEWCRRRGVEFYAVKNMYFSRKLKADYFIDDRNIGGLPDWGTIYRIINERKTFAEIMMERQGQTEKPYKPKKKHWWG